MCDTCEDNGDVIDIMGLHFDDGENRTWRVTWPNPDESRGSHEFQTCELAVEYALLIRITMDINEGRRCDVVVLDENEHSPPWRKEVGPDTNEFEP